MNLRTVVASALLLTPACDAAPEAVKVPTRDAPALDDVAQPSPAPEQAPTPAVPEVPLPAAGTPASVPTAEPPLLQRPPSDGTPATDPTREMTAPPGNAGPEAPRKDGADPITREPPRPRPSP